MAIRKILQLGDPGLQEVAKPDERSFLHADR